MRGKTPAPTIALGGEPVLRRDGRRHRHAPLLYDGSRRSEARCQNARTLVMRSPSSKRNRSTPLNDTAPPTRGPRSRRTPAVAAAAGEGGRPQRSAYDGERGRVEGRSVRRRWTAAPTTSRRRRWSRTPFSSWRAIAPAACALGRALQRARERSEIALVDDQRHALEAAAVVVGAEANLVGEPWPCRPVKLQQLDGGPVVRRLDLRFLFDDTVASWSEKVSSCAPMPSAAAFRRTSSP
jgi:hypothetical protein